MLEYKRNDLMFKSTGRLMCFDVAIPELSIAFEYPDQFVIVTLQRYQGIQHYSNHFMFGPCEGLKVNFKSTTHELKRRDEEKRQACRRVGLILFEIPYWWDERQGSLMATIQQVRPDLVSQSTEPPISPVLLKQLKGSRGNIHFCIHFSRIWV